MVLVTHERRHAALVSAKRIARIRVTIAPMIETPRHCGARLRGPPAEAAAIATERPRSARQHRSFAEKNLLDDRAVTDGFQAVGTVALQGFLGQGSSNRGMEMTRATH